MEKNEQNSSFLNISNGYDEDFKLCDYTPEEMQKILAEIKPQTQKNKINKSIKIKNNQTQKFKDDYFSYYDDVKSSSLKKQDW